VGRFMAFFDFLSLARFVAFFNLPVAR
jgi:hypothetical protein